MRLGRLRTLPLLAALLLLGARPAPAEEPPVPEPRYTAPRGCWTAAGGCAARTGACDTPSIRGSVVEAWSWTVPGDPGGVIDEEPRVAYDRVYVCVRSPKGDVSLHVLGLDDGKPHLPPYRVTSAHSLEPCLLEAGVLVRSGPAEIRIVRSVEGRWVTVWGPFSDSERLDAPVATERMVCARTSEGLAFWELPSLLRKDAKGERNRGRPALDGNRAWSVGYDEAGNATARHGTPKYDGLPDAGFLGHHGAEQPPADAWTTRVAALPFGCVVALHGTPVRTTDGWLRTTSMTASIGGNAFLFDFLDLPAVAGGSLLVFSKENDVTALRKYRLEGKAAKFWNLASLDARPEFFRPDLPVSLAQNVAWVGTNAFDIDTSRVVCRLPDARARFRAVPAEGAVLIVPEKNRITAWREATAAPEAPHFLGPAFDGRTAVAQVGVKGRALFRDDTLFSGTYDLDPVAKTVTLQHKSKPQVRPLEEALVLVRDPDRLLYVASLRWVERHLARLAALDRRDEALKVLRAAAASQDPALTETALLEALMRGVPEKDAAFARRAAESLRQKSASVFEAKRQEAEPRLAALRAGRPEEVLALLASALEDPRPDVQRRVLRLVLDRQPDHAAAVALVRASIPAHVRVPERFVARDWLDLRTTLAAIPTKPVDVPKEGSRPLTRGERELGAARAYWRKDLVGVESPQLLVMSSLAAPERLAACLSLGELVCTALEGMFAGGQHVRKDRWPLILQLFETEEEYRKFAVGNREPHGTQEWSAGHYDPEARVSRIYVPKGDAELEDVRRTYVHELTHHWIQERCPLFEERDARSSDVVWIVEGMAVLVESFEWNVAERSWETFVPSADCLDTVAEAPEPSDWIEFFDVQYRDFVRIDRKGKYKLNLRNYLGYTREASQLDIFYALSGTVCAYLFHKGPKERAALLEYVRDAYIGKVKAATPHIRERFGMSPAELGRAAVAWAKDVTSGSLQRGDVFLK